MHKFRQSSLANAGQDAPPTEKENDIIEGCAYVNSLVIIAKYEQINPIIMYIHCAPLERGDGTHHDSIDIAQDLLSQDWLSRALFAYLISSFSRLILWSETILRRNAYVNPVIERKWVSLDEGLFRQG